MKHNKLQNGFSKAIWIKFVNSIYFHIELNPDNREVLEFLNTMIFYLESYEFIHKNQSEYLKDLIQTYINNLDRKEEGK